MSEHRPHLVILSLSLPAHRTLELVKDLALLHAGLKFLIVTSHGQLLDTESILRAGAHGSVSSSSGAAAWLVAARQILAGGHSFGSLPASRPVIAPCMADAALALAC